MNTLIASGTDAIRGHGSERRSLALDLKLCLSLNHLSPSEERQAFPARSSAVASWGRARPGLSPEALLTKQGPALF